MYKVLIVEDEDIIRKGIIFMMDWLKAECVVVGEASDGNEGLQKIAELQPDIVITDVKMPFKNGLQMLEESHEIYDYEAIVVSGYDEFSYAKKAISLDVTEYLLKPVDFDCLYRTLEKLKQKIRQKKAMFQYQEKKVHDLSETALDLTYRDKNKYTIKLLKCIQEKYGQKISIHGLSELYGISSVYLNMKFKQDMHYTFNDFLNRYRIMQAVKLLKQREKKVYEIAACTGFQDYKYFTFVFKKYVGCSPSRFLEMMSETDGA